MFWTTCISCDEWQVNVCGSYARQFDFCLFSSFFQTLVRHLISGQVNARILFEFFNQPIHDALVKVITTQVVITGCSFNFEYAIAQFKDGYVEGTTAQVKYENLAIFFFIYTISQSCCCWFVDDTKNIQACDSTRIFSCLPLGICEISRNCDNCLGYGFTQVSFCISFNLLQDHSRNFLRCVGFTFNSNLIIFTHMTFNRSYCIFRVRNSLTFCQLAYQTFTVFSKTNNRRSSTSPFLVSNYNWFAAFHNRYTRVSCT